MIVAKPPLAVQKSIDGQLDAPNDRRRALVRLGLAIGGVYVAPTILSIDRKAWAMGPSCAVNPKNC